MKTIDSATFSQHLHTSFRIPAGNGEPIVLELIEVEDRSSPQMEQFSLLFRGPLEPALDQGIRELEHAELGPMALFLVPVGPNRAGTGMRYQAVFNRIREVS